MTRFFDIHSSSVPTSMDGIGAAASTTAVRNKREDWLSRGKSGIVIKVIACVAIVVLVSAATIVSVPLVRKYSHFSKDSSNKLSSTYHNKVINGTYESSNLDEMLKSFGNETGFEKNGLQGCDLNPESRGELGKGTWTFLHIMASTYPVNPSPEVKQDHKIFFQLLPRIYPCPDCRVHMRQMFHEFPPKLNSRQEFMHWLCEAHNLVNRRLNKPVFDCDKLDDRWDCGCNIVPGQAINEPAATPDAIKTRKSEKKSRESKKDTDRKSKKSQKSDAPEGDINQIMTLKPETTKARKN